MLGGGKRGRIPGAPPGPKGGRGPKPVKLGGMEGPLMAPGCGGGPKPMGGAPGRGWFTAMRLTYSYIN